MPYAKLRTDLLAARSRRQRLVEQNLPPGSASLLQLSLNIPGVEKHPPGSTALFDWGWRELHARLPLTGLLIERDRLGCWGLGSTSVPPVAAKGIALQIEAGCDFARLLDIDVYAANGQSCDRRQLGVAQRSCLLCGLPARQCIRLQCHSELELKGRLEELLQPFTA